MRPISGLFLLLAASAAANAHTLGADAGMPSQIEHQFFGVHHLPLTVLLIIGGIMLFRRFRKLHNLYKDRIR